MGETRIEKHELHELAAAGISTQLYSSLLATTTTALHQLGAFV